MKIFAINGGPRKKHNTETLLQESLKGVRSVCQSAETELIDLYKYRYVGCVSCFACKKLGGKSYGKCAVHDDITPVLQQLAEADGIIFGSPIYFANITGELRSFLERLMFQYFVYDGAYTSLAPKKFPTAFIYTMGLPKDLMIKQGYPEHFQKMEFFIEKVWSKPNVLYSYNSYQFDDYALYETSGFSEPEKAAYRDKYFPEVMREAFDLGADLAARANA